MLRERGRRNSSGENRVAAEIIKLRGFQIYSFEDKTNLIEKLDDVL